MGTYSTGARKREDRYPGPPCTHGGPWRCPHGGGRASSGSGCPKEMLGRAREGQPFMGWVGAFLAPVYPFATVRASHCKGYPVKVQQWGVSGTS